MVDMFVWKLDARLRDLETKLEEKEETLDARLRCLETEQKENQEGFLSEAIDARLRCLETKQEQQGDAFLSLKQKLSSSEPEILKKVSERLKAFECHVTSAIIAVNNDLDGFRDRVDATHTIVTAWPQTEAAMAAKISAIQLDVTDMQAALQSHDSWLEDSFRQFKEVETITTENLSQLRGDTSLKLDAKLDMAVWEMETNDLKASLNTIRSTVSTCCLDMNARCEDGDNKLAAIGNKVTVIEANVEELLSASQGSDLENAPCENGNSKLPAAGNNFTDIAADDEALPPTPQECDLEKLHPSPNRLDFDVSDFETCFMAGDEEISKVLPNTTSQPSTEYYTIATDDIAEESLPRPSMCFEPLEAEQVSRRICLDDFVLDEDTHENPWSGAVEQRPVAPDNSPLGTCNVLLQVASAGELPERTQVHDEPQAPEDIPMAPALHDNSREDALSHATRVLAQLRGTPRDTPRSGSLGL